jgi:hypothetical protein
MVVRFVVPAVREGRRRSVSENRRVSLRVTSLGDDGHEHGLKHQGQRGAGHLAHYRNPARLLVIRGVDLISDALPFGRLRYGEPTPFSLPPHTQQISRDFYA